MRQYFKVSAYTFMYTCFIGAVLFLLFSNFLHLNQPVSANLENSVTIFSGNERSGAFGSGVVFINNNRTFVWTCAHVVANSVEYEVEIDFLKKTIKPKLFANDVHVSSKLFNDNLEESGIVTVFAKIIRYSDTDDLALLELHNTSIFKKSVAFPSNSCYTTPVGTKIFHIGSMAGPIGFNSVSEGVSGIHGVDVGDQKLDRIGLGIERGSSGGGIFEVRDGKCIGLISRGINVTQGFMIPYRTMYKMAERLECTWALDSHIEIPTDYLDMVTDMKVVVPPEIARKITNVP